MPPVEVPSHEVEELEDRPPGPVLELCQNQRGYQPANSPAVDGEDAHYQLVGLAGMYSQTLKN